MKDIKIKTVYVPVNGSSTLFVVEEGRISDSVEEQQLITFTPEEYNKHIQEVIDDALETAAEKAYVDNNHIQGCAMDSDDFEVNKESITDTFEETFKKFKI